MVETVAVGAVGAVGAAGDSVYAGVVERVGGDAEDTGEGVVAEEGVSGTLGSPGAVSNIIPCCCV